MRKYIIVSILALCVSALALQAQDLLRYNYLRNGYVYSGTERLRVEGTTPVELKTEKVHFKDGSDVYILRIEFEDSSPWKMPANAPLTIGLKDGKSLIFQNGGGDTPNLVAPQGIDTQEGKAYWNFGKYFMEEADVKKLSQGVTYIDATRRWSADGHVRVYYKNDEFAAALRRQLDELKYAPEATEELGSNLRSLQDQGGNRMAETNDIEVNDKLSLSLVYLYYAPTNAESYDLNLLVWGETVPLGAEVTITMRSGDEFTLHQEKKLPAGRVICYPDNEQVKSMRKGVSKLAIKTTDGTLSLTFPTDEFSATLSKLYNSLHTIAIL